MKKLFVLVLTFLLCSFYSKSQFNVGVSPGFVLNSFYVGYQFGDFVPYIGLQFLSGSVTSTHSYDDFDNNGNRVHSEDKEEISGNIFMPYLGVKYFALKEKDLKGYVNFCLFKPLVSLEEKYNGEINQDLKSTIDKLSILGFDLGIGAEYFLSKQFSIGGEFGVHLFWFNFDIESTRLVYNPTTGESEPLPDNWKNKLNLTSTFTKIILNYYFN